MLKSNDLKNPEQKTHYELCINLTVSIHFSEKKVHLKRNETPKKCPLKRNKP